MPITSIDITARITGQVTHENHSTTQGTAQEGTSGRAIDMERIFERWGERARGARALAAELTALPGLLERGIRMSQCGKWLDFATCPNGDHAHLARATFCRDRLCPICAGGRARDLARDMLQEIDCMGPDQRYALLTLTAPNVEGQGLGAEIRRQITAWTGMSRLAPIKRAVIGWARKLEVTLNDRPRSKSYGTHHVHLHIMLALHDDYFNSPDLWLSQRDYQRLWAEQLGHDLTQGALIVHVAAADGGAAEMAKYVAKPWTYVPPPGASTADRAMRRKALAELAAGLRGTRTVAFGGHWRDIRRLLGHTNREDAAPETDEKLDICPECGEELERLVYLWAGGEYQPTRRK